jgi:hypothetical protein
VLAFACDRQYGGRLTVGSAGWSDPDAAGPDESTQLLDERPIAFGHRQLEDESATR